MHWQAEGTGPPRDAKLSGWVIARRVVLLAVGTLCAGAVACRPSVAKYKISGQVRYAGTPIPVGSITFEPTEGIVNRETVAVAEIREGRYEAYVVGGPHRVSIRDLTAETGTFSSRPLFWFEYHSQIDLPVRPAAPVQHDFDIPRTHR